MLKLLKYLKQSTLQIVLIVILLVLQAYCDLSLPQYTSEIVNVGIQQGGIEQGTPNVMRATQFDKLLLFVDNENKDFVRNQYMLLSKDSLSDKDFNFYVKSYGTLKEEDLYLLDMEDSENIDELNGIMEKAFIPLTLFEGDSEQALKVQESFRTTLPPNMANQDILSILSMMPEEQLDSILNNMKQQFDTLPDALIKQMAIESVKGEYNVVGVNMDKLQRDFILKAGAKMLGLALLSMVATIIVGYFAAIVSAKLGRNLRSRVFSKVVSFSNNEFDHFSTASLITRSTNDIQQIQMLMVVLLRIIFFAPIMGIGGIIKVLNTNTSMAWIIAIAVMAILSLVLLIFAIAMPKFKLMQILVDKLNLVTREILTGISVIRAFSTQKHEEKRFDEANINLTKTNLFVTRTMTFMMPLMMLIMNGITVLIVWRGSYGVDAGNMQVGDLMAFIQYTMQIIMSFFMISMVSIMLPRASVSATRIVEVLDMSNSIEDPKNTQPLLVDKKGMVEFKNVHFRYPNAEEDVLSDITFTAKPGETTAIIGSTGSGKTTLINLIPRFFDRTSGEILVDGIDIHNITLHDLRDKLGFVPQKGVLFSGTIDSNIRYGKQDATNEEIERAARIAQAISFIEEKPERYHESISQGGSNISGGQKQRLSIARAIAKNPDVYIFDDSFSALDYKTDVTLRKALKEEIADATVIIVAQRISTILNADQILVLEEGKIVGIGKHKELLNTCEVYKQIALSQLSKEELENE